MHTKRYLARGIILALVIILVAGCASPTPASIAAPNPTAAPLSCPTSAPLSCPTAVAQAPATDNAWKVGMADNANVIITFDAGDKCSMDMKTPVSSAEWAYEIVVNDDVYQNYVVAALTLDEGKTLKDLQDYNEQNMIGANPPSFAQLRMFEIVEPLSSTFHGVSFTGSPIYFVCLIQGPEDQRVIDQFGPVKIIE